MRTVPTLAIVLSLGMSLMVLGALGVSTHFGTSGEVGLEEKIENQSDQNRTLDPDEGDDGGFFSFIVGALSQMSSLLATLLYLPATLESLGAPTSVARAIGHGIQLVIALSLIQIAIQFDIR